MYIPRYLEDTILKIHKTFKVLYLGGPRQVGKTTLLQHLAKKLKIHYISLDNLNIRRLAQEDPELFLQKYSSPLFIDEAQYAPQLFPYIKIAVDASNQKGQYWLTGSQQFAVMKNLKESLAGRVAILNLLGFSMAEREGLLKSKNPFLPRNIMKISKTNIKKIFEYIHRGSFPVLWQKNPPPLELFLDSYIQTYIDRDLKEIFHVGKIFHFHTFLQLCAARTGQILNYSELARDAHVSVNAAREWIGILEASMQIFLLHPYYNNISKRLIKSPKLYFLDTGLAAYLTQWKTPEILMNGAMAGAYFETFVVTEIIKSYFFRGEKAPIYYFRDKEGHEVDLLIEKDQSLYPVEIKMASKIDTFDLKGINYLRTKYPKTGKGAIISLSSEQFPFDRENEVIPVSGIF